MQGNWLLLDEDRILVEQLRLLLRNVASALIPTFFLTIVLVWALTNGSNATALKVWGVVLMLSKLYTFFHSRHHLAAPIMPERAHRLTWELLVMGMIEGMIWGALVWITLDTSTLTGSILVCATLAAMVGSSMARLSPVMPVFIAFVTSMLSLASTKVWLMGDPAYDALAMAGLIYLFSILLMARNASREISAAIKLRYENTALLKQLQIKTEISEIAQRDAEYANTAKSKFLAAASHDLRQPIHAQGLFLEVLSRTELSMHQRELIASARAASEASSEMLNTLLDFSRIEAGVIEPKPKPFRLQPLLNKIENELAPQADAKNIVYRTRETFLISHSDPVLLEMILRNLVSNAIRYTNRGGVLVGCRRRGSQVVLEVWDTGIGIDPAHQREIFREFHQLGNPERDRAKGLGLGLSIAERLSRTLGHELSLSSRPNRGSVFRLSLPIANVSLPIELASASLDNTRLLEVRVLVIDDDPIVRDGMCHLLRNWGCICEAAEDIEDALLLSHLHPPGLIISDYRLRKQRTGVEAIAAVRALLGRNLPALLITGDTAPERLREAESSGIPLLHKPVSPGQLYHKLLEVLGEE